MQRRTEGIRERCKGYKDEECRGGKMGENKKRSTRPDAGGSRAGDVMAFDICTGAASRSRQRRSTKPAPSFQCLGWSISGGYRGVVDAEGAIPDRVICWAGGEASHAFNVAPAPSLAPVEVDNLTLLCPLMTGHHRWTSISGPPMRCPRQRMTPRSPPASLGKAHHVPTPEGRCMNANSALQILFTYTT
jgi:hypothetical protein